MNADLAFALSLADLAEEITMRHFRSPELEVETKSDLTPVSVADRETEEALRSAIARERPGEAVLAEEFGLSDGVGSARWILDPIDGTKHYVRGIPLWATLIALERNGVLEIGVVSAPALRLRWWGVRGEGAQVNGRAIHVSSVSRMEEAAFSHASLRSMDEGRFGPGVRALAGRVRMERGFGDFWQHMLVAEGCIEFALDPGVSVWDLAAVKVIVEEAGGRFTDLTGAPQPDGGSGLSSNGLLHNEVLAALAADSA